ncbi:MAG TPA: hypothetical protein VEJ20_05830 [Candidatus Eremiobacteraceae bacterium]|nr:hypothetical protein [Candidatus Eremiobacteraceae bacterium]
MIRMSFRLFAAVALVGLAAIAGCSTNAGFGTPPPVGTQPQANATPYPASPTPYASQSPAATPTPQTPLSVDSASARQAYDASAADPVKAPRLIEVTFALNNPGASPMPVPNIAIAASPNPAVNVPIALQALGNQDTPETIVAIAQPKDTSKVKQLALTFGDGKSLLLALDTIDYPATGDFAITPLDKAHPAGALTIDDVAVTAIAAPGKGPHFDVTFSATNAGTSKVSVAWFTVAPPKSDAIKIVVPVDLPARTETAPVSMVVPFSGKALPPGTYTVTASDGTNTIATGTGPLL